MVVVNGVSECCGRVVLKDMEWWVPIGKVDVQHDELKANGIIWLVTYE